MRVTVLGLLFACVAGVVRAAPPVDLNGVWLRPPQKGAHIDPRGVNPPISPAPLNAPYAQQYAASEKIRAAADAAGEPLPTDKAQCLPDGMPYVMETSLPVEFMQFDDKIVLIFEMTSQIRHIYLGGARHPEPDDLEPTFFGDSVGHWEGKALVVDTIGVRAPTTMFARTPHGEKLDIAERYELVDNNLMKVTITMTDPEYLSAPWVVTRMFARQNGMRVREYVCLENQRSYVDDKGRLGSVLKDK